jgi:hypothetical protein
MPAPDEEGEEQRGHIETIRPMTSTVRLGWNERASSTTESHTVNRDSRISTNGLPEAGEF